LASEVHCRSYGVLAVTTITTGADPPPPYRYNINYYTITNTITTTTTITAGITTNLPCEGNDFPDDTETLTENVYVWQEEKGSESSKQRLP